MQIGSVCRSVKKLKCLWIELEQPDCWVGRGKPSGGTNTRMVAVPRHMCCLVPPSPLLAFTNARSTLPDGFQSRQVVGLEDVGGSVSLESSELVVVRPGNSKQPSFHKKKICETVFHSKLCASRLTCTSHHGLNTVCENHVRPTLSRGNGEIAECACSIVGPLHHCPSWGM